MRAEHCTYCEKPIKDGARLLDSKPYHRECAEEMQSGMREILYLLQHGPAGACIYCGEGLDTVGVEDLCMDDIYRQTWHHRQCTPAVASS